MKIKKKHLNIPTKAHTCNNKMMFELSSIVISLVY